MLHYKKTSQEPLQACIAEFRSRKLIFNNYYGVDLEDVDFVRTRHTLALRKDCGSFHRLYLMSDDAEDLTSLLEAVESNHAINIPSKTGIPAWESLLQKTGFASIGVYERYYNTRFEGRGEPIDCFALENDFDAIRNILYSNFSPITDRLPNDAELSRMIRNQQVMVNRKEGQVTGLFIFTLENRKCYFNIWIDLTGSGLHLLLNVYNLIVEKGLQYVYLWIREGNTISIKTHLALGAVRDGLKDYTFIKN